MNNLPEEPIINARISAVIVTYQPSLERLKNLLSTVSNQVEQLYIIDNNSSVGSLINLLVGSIPNAEYIPLPENKGIGFAQNVGIRASHEKGIDYVLTLDQDSLPTSTIVRDLALVFQEESTTGRIAAVGPMLIDEDTRLPLPFFSYSQGYKHRIMPKIGLTNHDVDFLVSSGSLISMLAILEIGLMREELFISYADVDWCLRAKCKGFRILGACSSYMNHNLGDKRIRLGRFILPLHSPLRHFYLFRSGTYMQKIPYITKIWKAADRKQLLRSFIIFSLIGLPKFSEFISMVRGVYAGLQMRLRPVSYLPQNRGLCDRSE